MSFWLREDVTDADWLHLMEGEQVRWSGRPSLITLFPAFVVMLVLILLGVVLSEWLSPIAAEQGWPPLLARLPLLLAVVGMAYATVAYLKWVRLLYVITDEEIYVKIGLISRDVTQVPLPRVQNIEFTQSILERFLSFGTIHVYTAGTHTEDLELEYVPDPQVVTEVLTANLSRRQTDG